MMPTPDGSAGSLASSGGGQMWPTPATIPMPYIPQVSADLQSPIIIIMITDDTTPFHSQHARNRQLF